MDGRALESVRLHLLCLKPIMLNRVIGLVQDHTVSALELVAYNAWEIRDPVALKVMRSFFR